MAGRPFLRRGVAVGNRDTGTSWYPWPRLLIVDGVATGLALIAWIFAVLTQHQGVRWGDWHALAVSADDARHMQDALAVAEQGLGHREMPIGAVVVVDGDIVASAYTQERTQRRLLVHAELLALDQADCVLDRRRRQATLYTTLEPCLACLGAAMTVGIGRIVFALESPADGAARFVAEWDRRRSHGDLPGYQLPAIQAGVRRDESWRLFARFASQPGRNNALVGWAQTLAEL